MPFECEVCGNPVTGAPRMVMIDGSVLQVCNSCARLGGPVILPKREFQKPFSLSNPRPKSPSRELLEPELELRPDFHRIIREAREKMGLSQEQLGLRIAEKTSVIKLLEGGRLKPDIMLARKLERFLKIRLFAPAESFE